MKNLLAIFLYNFRLNCLNLCEVGLLLVIIYILDFGVPTLHDFLLDTLHKLLIISHLFERFLHRLKYNEIWETAAQL
jgi:hypothetical protein